MIKNIDPRVAHRRELRRLLVALSIVSAVATGLAQSFSSGSDGSDGPLTLAANLGTVVFDPFDAVRWGKVLDADGDGVYNFTTIDIGAQTTLKLRGDKVNRPVYFLASGDVRVPGKIDLNGAEGHRSTAELDIRRQVAVPGSGGYAGGAGGRGTPALPATPGEGPGGGTGGTTPCPPSFVLCGKSATVSGSRFAVPLVGGSGGEGASHTLTTIGPGGGAGGGAILIASSTSITISGQITAGGGDTGLDVEFCCTWAGGGAGGAIRLVSPTIGGNGSLSVAGGNGRNVSGASGWVRLEANDISTGLIVTTANVLSKGAPGHSSTLRPSSSIRVTAIDGIPVPMNPSGLFQLPDVTISKDTPANVDIEASGIPPGTVVTLRIYPETPADFSLINLPAVQATLSGTLQSSTATASITFPFGYSRAWIRATWTQ